MIQAFQKEQGQWPRHHARPSACPVLTACRITLRASALSVPANVPLAVCAISSSPIGHALIRASAHATFNLSSTDKSLLHRTCHSLRVTAANVLPRANKYVSDFYIQPRIRWKSNIFPLYRCNSFYSADQDQHLLICRYQTSIYLLFLLWMANAIEISNLTSWFRPSTLLQQGRTEGFSSLLHHVPLYGHFTPLPYVHSLSLCWHDAFDILHASRHHISHGGWHCRIYFGFRGWVQT